MNLWLRLLYIYHLTVKTLFLVAMAFGQRRSSLHALCVSPGHVRWENRGVRLIPIPSFIAKNQTASSGSVEVFLSPLSDLFSVPEDKVWCPVRALKWYLEKTKSLCKDSSCSLSRVSPFLLPRESLQNVSRGGSWRPSSRLGRRPLLQTVSPVRMTRGVSVPLGFIPRCTFGLYYEGCLLAFGFCLHYLLS